MITDLLNDFGAGADIALNTGAAGDYVVGNTLDLVDIRNIGAGQPIYWVITVGAVAFTGGGTVDFSLAGDTVTPIVAGGLTRITSTPLFAAAAGALGSTLYVGAVPAVSHPWEQYLGIVQKTEGAAFTAGTIRSFFTFDPTYWRAYAEGQN